MNSVLNERELNTDNIRKNFNHYKLTPSLKEWFNSIENNSGVRKNRINNLLENLENEANETEYSYDEKSSIYVRVAYSLLEKALNEAIENINKNGKYKNCFLERDIFYKETPWLIILIELGITPNEIRYSSEDFNKKPASIANIFNALWIWYLSSGFFDEKNSCITTDHKLIKAFEIVLRAIETSHLQSKYNHFLTLNE